MEERQTYRYYDYKKVPPKEKIELILDQATRFTPIKGFTYYFRIEVFGPEYHEEKLKFALQTVCNDNASDLYNAEGGTDQKNIHLMRPHLERCMKEKHQMETIESKYRFNLMCLAPYLLKYTYKKRDDGKVEPLVSTQGGESSPRDEERMMMGAAMHGMTLVYCAVDQGLDATFMRSYMGSKYNPNAIFTEKTNEDTPAFFIGIGYGDKEAEKHSDVRVSGVKRPHYNKIVTWK